MNKETVHILLIEDDEDDYLLLRNILSKVRGMIYDITWEKTYNGGLTQLKTNAYDVYLIDYRLGAYTGLDILKEAEKNEVTKPVIILTGLGAEDLGVKSLRAGAEDYLVKGDITPTILERTIRYAIERNEANIRQRELLVEQRARQKLESQNEKLESLLSQLKTSQEKVKESEQHFASIVATLAEGVTIQNTKGIVQMANKSAEKILGFSKHELLGKISADPVWKSVREDGSEFPPEEHPSMWALKTGEVQTNVVMGIERPDGTKVWLLVSATPLFRTGEKNPYEVVSSFVDITERKNLDHQKDYFISIASHELKTPVTGLKLFADILLTQLKGINNEALVNSAKVIRSQADRLTNLLNYLLDTSRIQTGRLELNLKTFNVDTFIQETIENIQYSLKKHTLTYESKTESIIVADKERLAQVLNNLVSNAAKYSPDADKIIIKAEKKAHEIVISVDDFGLGIPTTEQEQIFERFFRTAEAKQRLIPGIGLGLYICSEIVRKHGGQIWVKSIKGKGSTFYFSIPTGMEARAEVGT